ncbi:3-keto-5-aminohexanoate cleavage protein [Brevundimonas lenta]|uniref:Uncharacterized protein (DUF849 family) n=1 Tax=Brevundimonas lenta TaxID=424796 RepID=A0A7W6JAJ5_9CAUL|nr:3-keto-5-aminohexanoate cleavage protein [Brevundimonas lenta]MBB4081547.1 uncharacterized protein (DUF849 family) [Brevundimonas lenta]
MYFTDDSLLPENQDPLIITAAPYGPMWLPEDYPTDIDVSWDAQVQKAVDCYNAGATVLHIHVRDPQTGKISKNFNEYNDQIGRLRNAVPKMVLQVGGSISFAPPADGEMAQWQGYDTRHMLTEINPKPDQITVAVGTSQWDITSISSLQDWPDRMANEQTMWAFANMSVDALPDFYIEHLKRLKTAGIQPYFALGHIHGLEIVERLIRRGQYMGPVNGFFSMGGGGTCGVNPFDWMELVRRTPQGSIWTYQTMFRHSYPLAAMMIALGQHTRAGIEENLWDTTPGKRLTSVQMIEKHVRMAKELGRPVATAEEAREIMKLGVTYNSTEETLLALGLPPNRPAGERGFITYPDTTGKVASAYRAGSDGHALAGEY